MFYDRIKASSIDFVWIYCCCCCDCSIKFFMPLYSFKQFNKCTWIESKNDFFSISIPRLFFVYIFLYQLYGEHNASYIFMEYTNVCQTNQHQLYTVNQSSVFSKWCYTHQMKRTKIFHFNDKTHTSIKHSTSPFRVWCWLIFLIFAFARAFIPFIPKKNVKTTFIPVFIWNLSLYEFLALLASVYLEMKMFWEKLWFHKRSSKNCEHDIWFGIFAFLPPQSADVCIDK